MNRDDVLDRLHDADPVTTQWLAAQMPHARREAVRDRITATSRSRSARRAPSRGYGASRTGRRLLLTAVAAGVVAALVVAAGVVSRPDTPAGPTAASASEVLRKAADVARGAPDYTLSGSQRVYAGYLLEDGDRLVSGEWWVRADGSYLARTRTYSGPAARAMGIPVGDSDLVRSVKPTKDNGEPKQWSYDEIRAVPTDQAALSRWIAAEVARTPVSDHAPESVTNPTSRTLAVALDLVTQRLAPPALRSAGLEVIATLPGVVRLGAGTDRLGRTGELIGVPNRYDSAVQNTLLVDPVDGRLLESGTGAAVVSEPTPAGPAYTGPTGSAVLPASTRTYVGPTVVARELVVPDGVSVAPH